MLNSLPKLFGKIPVGAIAMIMNLVELIRNIGTRAIEGIANIWNHVLPTDEIATKMADAGEKNA